MRLTYESDKEIKQPKKKEPEVQSIGQFIWELAKIVIISLAIIIPIRVFLIQPFYVKGASMEPTFYDNQYLIIDEISYRFSEPQRGDVVVIKYPQDPSQYFIKRIIGLPGETIDIKDGSVYIKISKSIEEIKINEPYLAEGIITNGEKQISLGADEYYLLGDNRPSSLDSRSFGPVNEKYIVGKTWIRVWPFDKFHHFTMVNYNISP